MIQLNHEIERTKDLLETKDTSFNYVMHSHLKELMKLKAFKSSLSDATKAPELLTEGHQESLDDIVSDLYDKVSCITYKTARQKAVDSVFKNIDLDIREYPELTDLIEQGKLPKSKKVKERWHIPTVEECINLKDKFPKNRTIWTTDSVTEKNNDGDKQEYDLVFGTSSEKSDHASIFGIEKYFTYAVKGKKIKYLGFKTKLIAMMLAEQLNDKPSKYVHKERDTNNETKHKTKFTTPFKYVMFHYAFGSEYTIPTDSRAFAIRGKIGKTKKHDGIKGKDFEYSDAGLVHARFYIDQEIRKNGLDTDLHFNQSDYSFIEVYGPKMWIKITGWKTNFDFVGHKLQIIKRYYTVDDRYSITESYSKRLIVDNKIDFSISALPSNMLIGLSSWK